MSLLYSLELTSSQEKISFNPQVIIHIIDTIIKSKFINQTLNVKSFFD